MSLDFPPEVAEELTAVLKAIDGLRAGAANHRPPVPLEASDPDARAEAATRDHAMRDLEPLGFRSLGDAGQPRKDGSIAVSRWFAHADGTICGWLGFLTTKSGPQLAVYLISEAPGPAYCSSLMGGSGLSLARPPQLHHVDVASATSFADMVRDHRTRSATLGAPSTNVTTLGDALALLERWHGMRMAWRASCDPDDMLRADILSVLEHSYRSLPAENFWTIYRKAAEWLGFRPEGDRGVRPVPLALLLSSPDEDASEQGESGWLPHSEFELRGGRLQILDIQMTGNDGEGVILDAQPGIYMIEVRVLTDGIDRRVSRARVYPRGAPLSLGIVAGVVGVDLGAVAICDVDRLAPWVGNHEPEWQRWGHPLWFGRTMRAGVYPCDPAQTVVAFVESGYGDGTYPVYFLRSRGRVVGLEAEFISDRGAR